MDSPAATASLTAEWRKLWKLGTDPRSTFTGFPRSSTSCSTGNVGRPSGVTARFMTFLSSRRTFRWAIAFPERVANTKELFCE